MINQDQDKEILLAWKESLSTRISDPINIIQQLDLNPALLPAAKQAASLFKMYMTQGVLNQININDVNDPVLKQFLPVAEELSDKLPEFSHDPLNERHYNPVPGVLHKYPSRILITLSNVCAVHCRYCFRRNFSYSSNNPGKPGWSVIFDYIKSQAAVNEVILSGGDPLSVKDEYLADFTRELSTLPQIKRLRIHTRIPIVMPERITDALLAWIDSLPWPLVMVLHINHVQEIGALAKNKVTALLNKKVRLLNQSVLLKGVNDSVDHLAELSETLFAMGIMPYYLHLLDKVQGAAHFDVPLLEAQLIYEQLSHRLPGYLLPKLVREEPGKLSKTPLSFI